MTLLFTAGFVLICAQLSAQDRTSQPGRVYRGLFGGANPTTHQGLVLDARLGGGFDNNIITSDEAAPGAVPLPKGRKGSFQNGSIGLAYSLTRPRLSLDVQGTSNGSYYGSRTNPFVQHHSATASTSLQLWRGANLGLSHSIAFQPFYYLPGLATIGGVIDETSLAASVDLDETTGAFYGTHTTNVTSASFGQALTTRLTVSASFLYEQSRSTSAARDFFRRGGQGGLSLAIAKGLSLRVGYGHTETQFDRPSGAALGYRAQNIDAGLNFSRALSITRKTMLSFTSGSTAVTDGDRTFYHLNATVGLRRELGRTWRTGIRYNRDVNFDETLGAPVPYDSVAAALGGLFNRRLSFQSSVGKAFSRLGFGSQAAGLDNIYARSTLSIAITRNIAGGVEYSYFQYRFDQGSGVPLGVLRRAERQRVAFYVNFWAPLISNQSRGAR